MNRMLRTWKPATSMLLLLVAVLLFGGLVHFQNIETLATFRMMVPLSLVYAAIFLMAS